VLILKGLPCDAALRRGLLWHSWLKNQILKMNADYVAQMHGDTSLQEERESFERKIQAGGEFESKLSDARRFASEMIEGFSPAQLVDSGPLANLSAEARTSIKAVIHDEYLRQTMIEERTGPIASGVDDMERALKGFSTVWYRRPPAQQDLVKTEFERLQACARLLHEKLGSLPEGIVLP
jgi:hypothetical protein